MTVTAKLHDSFDCHAAPPVGALEMKNTCSIFDGTVHATEVDAHIR